MGKRGNERDARKENDGMRYKFRVCGTRNTVGKEKKDSGIWNRFLLERERILMVVPFKSDICSLARPF